MGSSAWPRAPAASGWTRAPSSPRRRSPASWPTSPGAASEPSEVPDDVCVEMCPACGRSSTQTLGSERGPADLAGVVAQRFVDDLVGPRELVGRQSLAEVRLHV